MNTQQVFNRVVTHLYTQKRRSYGDLPESENVGYNGCLYRGPDNTKCAVGIFIPDQNYTTEMEGKGATELFETFGDRLPKYLANSVPLLESLQQVHDNMADLEDAYHGTVNYGARNQLMSSLLHVCRMYDLDDEVVWKHHHQKQEA